ncbi:uncharacterized protein IWZ02DRAFT_34385 [Phyllosticta citriasiana]|uniref:uncharacterized protein n=1 Tax=Phyllosticta citriasiana TaxID=595635 RepID=UPI0030FD983A
MHLFQVILHLLLLANSHAVCAVAELFDLPVHLSVPRTIDCVIQPLLIMGFVTLELHGALFSSDEQRFGPGVTTGLLSYCLLLTFFISTYTLGFFWEASLELFSQLTTKFIECTTLTMAFAIPVMEEIACSALGQLGRLRDYRQTILSSIASVALVFAFHNFLVANAKRLVLFGLVFSLVSIFIISATVLMVGTARCMFFVVYYMTTAFLDTVTVAYNDRRILNTHVNVTSCNSGSCPLQYSLAPSNRVTSNSRTHKSTCRVVANQDIAPDARTSLNNPGKNSSSSVDKSRSRSSSGSSKPSVEWSNSTGPPSRPSTRTSVSATADHQQCLHNIQVLQMALDQVATENVRLAHEKTELSTENAFLKSNNEGLRHQAFCAEENFGDHINALKCLEAANSGLLKENEVYRLKLVEQDMHFDSVLKDLIDRLCPDSVHSYASETPSDWSTLSLSTPTPTPPGYVNSHSSLSSPEKPSEIFKVTGPSIAHKSTKNRFNKTSSLSTSTPGSTSSSSWLPYTPRLVVTPSGSIKYVSHSSLVKRRKPLTSMGPGLKTPDAIARFLGEKPYVPDKMVGPKTPVTVSSGCSLPFSPDESIETSAIISPASVIIPLKTRIGAGPGLPSPTALALGKNFPSPHGSPSIPSTSSPLPFSPLAATESSFGRVSINSLFKPSRHRSAGGNCFENPLLNNMNKIDKDPLMDGPKFVTPHAEARARRFSNYLDHEPSPKTVSSCSTLPVRSPSTSNTSSCDPFI